MAPRKLLKKGTKLVIEAETSESGHSQVEEFLRELASDASKKAWAAKLVALFQRLADAGFIQNTEVFKKLTAKVWEFRAGAARVLGGHLPGSRFLITNGFMKKSHKPPQRELDTAEAYLQRARDDLREGPDED